MPSLLNCAGALALGLAALFATTAGSSAQQAQRPGSGCILDNCRDRQPLNTPPATRDNAPASSQTRQPLPQDLPPGRFDFYLLSLSWSPSFCASTDRGGQQCAVGSKLGFVVHGLWPQFDRGFPQDCDSPNRNPSQVALQGAQGLFPDMGLARHEWQKHGTCTGRNPADYFADVRRARDFIVIPAEFKEPKSDRSVKAIDIQRAFIEANQRLRPGTMAIGCQGGMLQEVRLCLTKDLRDFRNCPEVVQRTCPGGRSISVPGVH